MKFLFFSPNLLPTKCLLITAVFQISSIANAAVVISNINSAWSNGYGFNPTNQIGLGFTTGSSQSSIDGLSLSLLSGLLNQSQTINFSVLLYNAGINGLPTGNAISQDVGITATWSSPVGGSFQQQTFTYSGAELVNLFAVTLSANSNYSLVLANNNGSPVFETYWALTTDAYTTSEGFAFTTFSTSNDDGSFWQANSSNSIASISVQTIPEPSGAALCGVAVSLMVLCSRRRRGVNDGVVHLLTK